MWKTIVLCASLFAGAAFGLAAAASFIEPKALPLAAAIGGCLVGVTLILAAPADPLSSDPSPGERKRADSSAITLTAQPPLRGVLVASSSGNLKAYEGPSQIG